MTWYFQPNGDTMDVYDHNGLMVKNNYEFGGTWEDAFPDEVLDIMNEQARQAINNGDTDYALLTLADAAFEQIEHGVPP